MQDKNVFKETAVDYWRKRFRNGNWEIEDYERSVYTLGRPSNEGVAIIMEAFEQNRAWAKLSMSIRH